MALQTSAWPGQKIFQLYDEPLNNPDEMISGYHQDQASLIYSREDVRRWFEFRPEIKRRLSFVPTYPLVAHMRHGDYKPLGYVVVSRESISKGMQAFGFDSAEAEIIKEQEPHCCGLFKTEGLSWLPDFWMMMKAKTLFRANSTFSWWAAILGTGRVFSPVITGLKGGIEQDDVPFVEGNWPRFADLECVTDLHLPESKAVPFREEMRYEYDLNPRSVVFDCGGYEGTFAAEINRRYKCDIHVFEPIASFREKIFQRISAFPNVRLHPYGIGFGSKTFGVKGDMTGEFCEREQSSKVILMRLPDVFRAMQIQSVDLLKLNIEGGEFYALLDLLEEGLISKFKNIQVQWHDVVPNATLNRNLIIEQLQQTHELTFDYGWTWQNWRLKK